MGPRHVAIAIACSLAVACAAVLDIPERSASFCNRPENARSFCADFDRAPFDDDGGGVQLVIPATASFGRVRSDEFSPPFVLDMKVPAVPAGGTAFAGELRDLGRGPSNVMVFEGDFKALTAPTPDGGPLDPAASIALLLIGSKAGRGIQVVLKEQITVVDYGSFDVRTRRLVSEAAGKPPLILGPAPPPGARFHLNLRVDRTRSPMTVTFSLPTGDTVVTVPIDPFVLGANVLLGYALDVTGPISGYEAQLDNVTFDFK